MSDDTTMDQFVQLSALLTGFSADVIAPTIDPIDLKATYLPLVQERTGDAFTQLLARFEQLSGGTPVKDMSPQQRQQVGEALLGDGTPSQAVLTAEAIIKLWYLGSWYQPFDSGTFTTDVTVGFVVSDQAYVKGLSWQVMQSHAMGNSTFTYGYWAEDPPPLSAFTGNSDPT